MPTVTDLGFFRDAALTQRINSLGALLAPQKGDHSLPPVDTKIYLGATTGGYKYEAASDPGVDPIVLTPVDLTGTGEVVGCLKLATTQGGLDAAVAGAALSIGTQILTGVGNATSFWVRQTGTLTTTGYYANVVVDTNNLVESAA